MDLSRHYFVADDLDVLDEIEVELERAGIPFEQVHVLTRDDAGVQKHVHLHGVPSFLKRDLVHSACVGAVVGVLLALMSLAVAFLAGWTDTAAGWVPFLYLAIVLLGFCTWFGGMHGLRLPNHHFVRFEKKLDDGKHVLFVDTDYAGETILNSIIERYPGVSPAGTGQSMPSWLTRFEKGTSKWWYWRMWRNV